MTNYKKNDKLKLGEIMKKVLSIVALCLIAILAGTIIVFSCVDRNYNIKLADPDFIQIQINSTENGESYFKTDSDSERQEKYNKVMELYNKSFKQKIMSGIFQGVISNSAKIERNVVSVNSFLTSGTYIAFNYNDPQTLKLNGKIYEYKSGSYTEKNIQFQKVYVEVKNTDAVSDINIYVVNKGSQNYSYYHYVVKAKQANLYEYIQENFAD